MLRLLHFWCGLPAYLCPAPAHYNQVLLSEQQRDRANVVLVSPRNPLNIGAAARAMANFGFSQLSVVAPYAPHWREARSAVGAPEILKCATVTDSLADAVYNCTLVAGTGTLAYRKPEQRVVQLPELPTLIREELDRGGRFALVFGPEKHGLTRDDLSYCHILVEIPTDPRQPSMNLGQAVAVCLYELAAHVQSAAQDPGEKRPAVRAAPARAAASENLELLANIVEQVMEAAHYSPASMRKANRHDARLLLRRLAPTEKDLRRILGLFRRILWQLDRRV
jgi:TrmH family RNA methyltransferase